MRLLLGSRGGTVLAAVPPAALKLPSSVVLLPTGETPVEPAPVLPVAAARLLSPVEATPPAVIPGAEVEAPSVVPLVGRPPELPELPAPRVVAGAEAPSVAPVSAAPAVLPEAPGPRLVLVVEAETPSVVPLVGRPPELPELPAPRVLLVVEAAPGAPVVPLRALLLDLLELPRPLALVGESAQPVPPRLRRGGGWDEREIGDYEPGDSRPREKDARHLLLAFEQLRGGIDAERAARLVELTAARRELAASKGQTRAVLLVGGGLAAGWAIGGARGVLLGGLAGAALALALRPRSSPTAELYAWAARDADGAWRIVDGPHWFTPEQAAQHLPTPSAEPLERVRWVSGAWRREEIAARTPRG